MQTILGQRFFVIFTKIYIFLKNNQNSEVVACGLLCGRVTLAAGGTKIRDT
jgi:hypothetical protein